MSKDNELYELCKEVYKRTGWRQEADISLLYKYWDDYDELCVISIEEADDSLVPAYTSDYLLEKLPRQIEDIPLCLWAAGRSDWMAEYDGTGQFEGANERISMLSDTPLKALLLLTLKLHEEKIL